jgi:hypothetical protein
MSRTRAQFRGTDARTREYVSAKTTGSAWRGTHLDGQALRRHVRPSRRIATRAAGAVDGFVIPRESGAEKWL